MKSTAFLLLLFFPVLLSHGQQKSDLPILSRQDSLLLTSFWNNFTTAVHARSKGKLAALCDFPFTCQQCVDDTNFGNVDAAYITVTKETFNAGLYNVFLENKLAAFIMQKSMPHDLAIFSANSGTKGGYLFSYITHVGDSTHAGQQVSIYVRKTQGKYKISGTDIIP